MTETREVSVTQEMIDCGVRKDCWACPIAKAIDAELATGLDSTVNQSWVSICRGYVNGSIATTKPPPKAVGFIWDFDNGDPVSPFAFPLTLPAELWRVKA